MQFLAVPLVPPTLAFAVGIALAPALSAAAAWWLWSVGVLGALAMTVLRRVAWAAAPLLASVVALGVLRAMPAPLPADDIANVRLPALARVEARLVGEPRRWSVDRTRLVLEIARVDDERRTGRIQVTLYGEAPPLTAGQRVAAELRLHAATGFRNPGGFDHAAHLAREGIHVVGTGRAERLRALDEPAPSWPISVKRGAVSSIEAALPPASAALLSGLLLGERTRLPREIDEGFRRAGVYHVLAVSGFNVALLGSSVFVLLLLGRVGRRGAALGAIVVVVGFAFVVGAEPSVVRAVIMAVLVFGAVVLDREASVMNSLAAAALIILAARPADLGEPGFQLSFAATAGIVLAPLPAGRVLGMLAVSAAAQLAVLPITLAHFNQLSTIGVLANLAVVPLAAASTVIGLLAVAIAPGSDLAAGILFDALWPILVALRAVVRLAASIPGAVVHLPAPHWTAIATYVAALGLALVACRRRRMLTHCRILAGAAGALLTIAVAIAVWPLLRPPDGLLRVSVLDVGQGDAIVIETPRGRALLIDAGAGGPMRFDTGEHVVAPYLWNRGFVRLAAAVTTHADTDHAGGMAAVRRLFRIDDSWVGQTRRPGSWSLDGVALTAYSVARDESGEPEERRPPRNQTAILLRLELGLASFLLTSDIGARTERELLRAGIPLAATVLKVAHHGSRGSSTPEFLRAVRPCAAVISVGARNAYGHPSPLTLERLDTIGASTYRTDRDGGVILETDGRTLAVTRSASRRTDRYCLDPETIC